MCAGDQTGRPTLTEMRSVGAASAGRRRPARSWRTDRRIVRPPHSARPSSLDGFRLFVLEPRRSGGAGHLSGIKQIVAEAIVASAGVLLGLATTALGSRKRVVVITSCDVIVMSANVFGGPKKALHRSGSEPILLGRKHGRFQEIALGGVSAWTTRSDEAALALRTLHPQGRFGATDF